ncbi:HNH endonuclease [Flavobacterium fluviale]|uniref:HNH nuclease domain-containing protein n=1 Tax=Flavobacterium fluviale TaxID=2249356 RepID=A0A344LMS7_9FLAO|nr:HNH endonuclease [Flavobacterium fluviale]AXB55219.1 hypothetical protein HYN86_00790 [Flavobacterium fluviale]
MDDWSIIQNQAEKLLKTKGEFHSLGGLVKYRLYHVDDEKIVVDRINGGNYALIGRLGALNAINRLKQERQIKKTDLINSVLRQTTLVLLHPNIYYDNQTKQIIWKDKKKEIKEIESFINQAKDDEIEKIQIQINKRRNQSKFRENICKLYENKCAISNNGIIEVLDAAHIISHSKSGINKNDNGILLRSDLHILFDKNLITIDPQTFEILIDKTLVNSSYYKYHKNKIKLPIGNKYLLKKWENQHS